MKYIKNPPTTQELKKIFSSEEYQAMLKRLENIGYKFHKDRDEMRLIHVLSIDQKKSISLNISFEELESEFNKNTDLLFKYITTVYPPQKEKLELDDENTDREFPEGEELDEDDKSEVVETLGYSETFLFNHFFILYLLRQNDPERLLKYLKDTRIPYAKKYQKELENQYKEIINQ